MGLKPKKVFHFCGIFIFAISCICLAEGKKKRAGDWSQYRGVNRDGVSLENIELKAWPAAGPKLVWRREIGEGFSGISAADGHFFTADAADSTEFLVSFDPKTGKDVWRLAMDDEFFELLGNGPRSTPSVSDGVVYGLSSKGNLLAADVQSGKELWRVLLAEKFEGKRPGRGYTMSPLADGDLLLLEAGGGEGKGIVALDKKTGDTRWITFNARAGHSSPVMAEIAGQRHYVFPSAGKAVGISPKGEVLWNIKSPPGMIAMPLFIAPNKIFLSGSMDDGCAMLQITPDTDSLRVDQIWANRMMINHFNSSVYHNGSIYGFSKATLTCIDAQTGERKWRKRGFGKGALIVVGNHLIVLSDQGELALVEATPEQYNEISFFPKALAGKSWTSPTFADGKLYLRNLQEMACYDLVN